jgi:hypothetical protein
MGSMRLAEELYWKGLMSTIPLLKHVAPLSQLGKLGDNELK